MLQSVRQGGTVRVYGALSGSQISFPVRCSPLTVMFLLQLWPHLEPVST